MTETRERICEQYQCGKPYFYALPEFGDLCKACYLKMHEDGRVKTIYIEGEHYIV